MHDRIVGNYVVLSAARATEPLVLPEHTNPITGAVMPAVALYNDAPLADAVPLIFSTDGLLIMLRGVWTGEQLFGMALLSHADGTGGSVLSYDQAIGMLAAPPWASPDIA
jgi:hypothetical protein